MWLTCAWHCRLVCQHVCTCVAYILWYADIWYWLFSVLDPVVPIDHISYPPPPLCYPCSMLHIPYSLYSWLYLVCCLFHFSCWALWVVSLQTRITLMLCSTTTAQRTDIRTDFPVREKTHTHSHAHTHYAHSHTQYTHSLLHSYLMYAYIF